MIIGMDTQDESGTLEGKSLPPSEWLRAMEGDRFGEYLGRSIYGNPDPGYLEAQRARFVETMKLHKESYGDGPAYMLRAPGRLNLFTEYLDMCEGDHLSTTIDGDIPLALSPAPEGSDRVRIRNTAPIFEDGEFRIHDEVKRFMKAPWTDDVTGGVPDNWDWRSRVHPFYGRRQGDPLNYVLAPYLRLAFERPDLRFRGCDLAFGPSTIPLRAGTSSSSAVVVLSMLCLLEVNEDRLPPIGAREVCRLLGEAEWYVGTHGGANDQTTILRNRVNGILYNLHHLELIDSKPLPWLEGTGVILCNSLWEADKALGARYVFNMRKGWMDLARDLLLNILSKERPSGIQPKVWKVLTERFRHIGWLDETLLGLEEPVISQFVDLLPGFIEPEAAGRILGKSRADMERDYTLPRPEDGGYKPRNAARFFFMENLIGRSIEALLIDADESRDSGRQEACRKRLADHLNRLQEGLRDVFQVSNAQIERLLEIARKGPGFMAGKLTGAGSGGCVCLLVEKEEAPAMLRWLDERYYGKRENFSEYTQTLEKLAASTVEEERLKAAEMKRNLESALASPQDHRRIITFSEGAGFLDFGEFQKG